MFYNDIKLIINLVANDKYVRFFTLLVISFGILIGFLYSFLTTFIIYISYILGYVVGFCLCKYQNFTSIYLNGLIGFCFGKHVQKPKIKISCSICDDLSCKRHLQSKSLTPWKYLIVQKDLNTAIERFYNKILENFISSWYSQFTEDKDFENELRYCLRFGTASVINRFLELDHSKIISTKLLPCILKHIDDYMYMQQIIKLKNSRFNDVIVEYLGKRLHAATSNRRNELGYLQHLSNTLIPIVLPEKYTKSRNFSVLLREILAGWVLLPLMDVLADPNIINSLVILATTYNSKKAKLHETSENVEFLDQFIQNDQRKSAFASSLTEIKRDTDSLYAFMQFLKKEGHVHLLQFCLDVDEFNNKLLTPELSKKQLEGLHSEAKFLYKEYFKKDSISFIGCSDKIIEDFNDLIEDGVYNVAKLRTSKPLYQAYEHTFNLLENVWLPAFFHSNEFYSKICGSKLTAAYNRTVLNSNLESPVKIRNRKYCETGSQGTVAKISSSLGKLKGALRTVQPIEGALYPTEGQSIENEAIENIIITECDNIFRDLTTWRTSITSYKTVNKVVNFCINITRLDAVEDDGKQSWTVLRKDQDFYTLKGKLVEFHGENEICDSPLPSRKAGNPIDVRMTQYETFLKRLLQKPFLRGSDLLYTFLTVEEDFSLLISSAQNNQDIGNIYQSVAHKLRKEKGQHLDSFMNTFLQSTGKTKQGKFEWAEMGDELDITSNLKVKNTPLPKTYRNYIFNDNFGVPYGILREASNTSFNPIGVVECVLYLLKYIFKAPNFVLRLYTAICSVAKDGVESFSAIYIENKLKSSLSQGNLTSLIKLLEDVVFHPHPSPTKDELEIRKAKAFSQLNGIVSPIMIKVLGPQFSEGLRTLLEILQHPHYNKQLAYNLLDIILLEMYPALGKQN